MAPAMQRFSALWIESLPGDDKKCRPLGADSAAVRRKSGAAATAFSRGEGIAPCGRCRPAGATNADSINLTN